MSEGLILEKLSNLEMQCTKTDKKVEEIVKTVSLIAVQSKQIDNMQIQLQSLWLKYDDAFKPEGTVSMIKQFQASCPRDAMKETLNQQWKTINRQWWALGFLATIVTGCLAKAFKLF